jgi:hypothetical protein
MVKLVTVARNLLIVAALALAFCIDALFSHFIPLGYEGMLAFGGLAFWFGVALTVVATVLAALALARYGRTRSRLVVLLCSVVLLISFALVASADILLSMHSAVRRQPSNQAMQPTAPRSDA